MPGFSQKLLHGLCLLCFSVFLDLTIASCPANEVLTDPEGEILSPNYPNLYPPNSRCNWTVSVHAGQSIAFYLNDLDLPPPPAPSAPCNVSVDYLSFTEDETQPVFECGNKKGTAFTSYGNEMTIHFYSDSKDDSYKGFNLTYTALGCVDVPENDELYTVIYDINDMGEQEATVECVTGQTIISACKVYKWMPSLSNIEDLCQPQVISTWQPAVQTTKSSVDSVTTGKTAKTTASSTSPVPIETTTSSSSVQFPSSLNTYFCLTLLTVLVMTIKEV